MDVTIQTTSPFRGWPAVAEALAALDPRRALGAIELIVHTLATRQDGVFDGQGAAPLGPTNVHVIARELVGLLPDEALPDLDPSAERVVLPVVVDLAREVNGLRSTALTAPQETEADALRLLWLHHLEQNGLAWSPKIELGRGWRMFAEIWPQLVESGRVTTPSYATAPFLNSAHMLLLAVALWHARGCLPDVREALGRLGLSASHVSAILEVFTCPLREARMQLAQAPKYPISLQNFFRRHSVIRSTEWGVFAPLPDLLLQCWDLQRLFETLECTLVNVPQRAAQRYYGSLGVVYEQYVRDLLHEIAAASGGLAVDPFPVSDDAESPDGFLVYGPDVLAFEAKSYRVPGRAYEDVSLDSFSLWFSKILGSDDSGRKPLVQGQDFYEKWKQGDANITARLGTSVAQSIYVVVTYEDPPVFTNWLMFRHWYLANHLEPATQREMWAQTIVVSVRALEALAGACRLAPTPPGAQGLPVRMFRDYLNYRDTEPDIVTFPSQMKSSFASWLLETHPWIRRSEPAIVSDARRRLFEAAQAVGVGGDIGAATESGV
ncbi:hypothetical protein [Polyangium sp. y55x31]|uniref:hypothetical protein n=1 Tax=Polyangium sp. y55x31 TaxID=3042688 RepID=UPI0024827E93|nr:hypothetical protein [Polyangium sp. y55x31]MDI1476353.1 hypothetical protein [Polyangium sp. y55x31]